MRDQKLVLCLTVLTVTKTNQTYEKKKGQEVLLQTISEGKIVFKALPKHVSRFNTS